MTESIFNLIGQHDTHPISHKVRTTVANHESAATHNTGHSEEQDMPPARKATARVRAGAMPNMAQFDLAHQHMHEDSAVARAEKVKRKPSVPAQKKPELDAVEIARRRQMKEMNGGAMAAALGGASALDRARAAKANHAAKNTTAVKEQSIINGLLKEQGAVPGGRPAARKPEFATKQAQPLQPGQRNYVQENKEAALEKAQQRSQAAAAARAKANGKMLKNDETARARPAGQIPKYLIERKIEMEIDKKMKEDAEIEARGERKQMPEDERVAMLAELERQRDAATRELNLIPPTKHQLVQYQTQIKKLEARLAEIEKAIILFSRKVVFIT